MRAPRAKPRNQRAAKPALVSTSEDGIAQLFAEENAEAFRYVREWSAWLKWNGAVWKRDARDSVIEAIRRRCRKLALDEPDQRRAERLMSLQKIKAIEQLARSDSRLAVDAELWDCDPWVINARDGVVCLRSGKQTPHDPARYMMKQSSASPQGACPRWHEFLRIITDGDEALAGYLQRIAGYCLTGSVSEQVFFYLWGKGANGKSVFTRVLAEILGSYATVAVPGMLTASHRDRHPTEIAKLRGARLVTAPEMEKGAELAINKLKLVTGGDRLTARKMHQDFVEFEPTFKLVLVGNALPKLADVDEAIRRRLRIIPFSATIPPTQRDPRLVEALLAEADGILAWAVEGCLAWQQGGLRTPSIVDHLTASHLEAADPIASFIQECCELGSSYSCGSGELYAAWQAWAARGDKEPLTQNAFSRDIVSRGFPPRRRATSRKFHGLRLKTVLGDAR